MFGAWRALFCSQRQLHTSLHDVPTNTLKRKIAEIEKVRKSRNPMKCAVRVSLPESQKWLDEPSLTMVVLVAVGIVVSKLLWMNHEATAQERLERRLSKLPPGTGKVEMCSRETWDELGKLCPQTPFDPRVPRPNAKIRTDEPVPIAVKKDWAIDVLADAFTHLEKNVRRQS